MLALAKQLELGVLELMARKELTNYAKTDLLVVQKALQVGEESVVDHWL